MKKMRIAIACSSLCTSRGGSERAATNLAAEMARRGHGIVILSAKYKGQRDIPLYEIPENVRHICWPFEGDHAEIKALRQRLLDWGADVFLSIQSGCEHLYWSMVCMGSGIPFICSERCDPIKYTEQRVWNRAGRHAVLAGADVIHELLPIYVKSIPEYFRSRVKIIPNAAPMGENRRCGASRNIIFLARFDEQKRPLLLLESFSLLADKYPDWNLHIWGHGPLENQIRKFIARSGLQSRIMLKGECRDMEKAYGNGQIYCLPSQYEGFPNSVLEAMKFGLAIVGIADCDAMRGIINEKNGILAPAPDPASLAMALSAFMADNVTRNRAVEGAFKTIEEYAPDKIYTQWEHLFEETATHKGRTVMDAFYEEPFAFRATLSASARREWLFRDFGETMPYTFTWFRERSANVVRHSWKMLRKKFGFSKKELS